MIEESATVIACEADYAIVETQSRPACGSCQTQSGCGTSVLSGLFKRRQNRLRVLNGIQALPGQRVIIGIGEQALVEASMIAYLLPLLSILLGAIAWQQIAQYWQWGSGELAGILGGISGLLIGLVLANHLSKRRRKDPSFQAVILRLESSMSIRFS